MTRDEELSAIEAFIKLHGLHRITRQEIVDRGQQERDSFYKAARKRAHRASQRSARRRQTKNA